MAKYCNFTLHSMTINMKLLVVIIICNPIYFLLAQNNTSNLDMKSNMLIYISQHYIHTPVKEGFVPSIDSMKTSNNNSFSEDDSLNKFSIINISTRPNGAQVFVDSVLIGESPISIKDTVEGEHWIHCNLKDFREFSTKFDIVRGIQQTLIITLLPAFGTLSLITKPEESLVTIDTVHKTYSPLNDIKLSVGTHVVSISHPNYEKAIKGLFNIYPGFHTTIEAGEKHFYSQTLLYSMFIPGLGQIIDQSYLKGSLELLAALGSTYFIFDSYSYRNRKQSDFELAKTQYNIASNETDAIIARTNMKLAANDLNRANDRLTASYWILGAAYVFSLVDALLFHTFRREIIIIDNYKINYPDLIEYYRNGNIELGFNANF